MNVQAKHFPRIQSLSVHSADDDEVRRQQSAACLAAISRELGHSACFPTLTGGLAPFDENLFFSQDQASAELDFPNVCLAACTQEQLSVFKYTKQTQACIQTLYKEVLKLPELSKHTVPIVQCKAIRGPLYRWLTFSSVERWLLAKYFNIHPTLFFFRCSLRRLPPGIVVATVYDRKHLLRFTRGEGHVHCPGCSRHRSCASESILGDYGREERNDLQDEVASQRSRDGRVRGLKQHVARTLLGI